MSGQSGMSGQSSTGTSAAGNSIEGCLGGSAGNFTIIDKAGVTYHLIIPSGADTSKLNSHIGQEVAVAGTVTNAGGSSASSSSPSSSASSTGSTAGGAAGSQPSIQVTKIDKVADTCSTNSTASPNPSH
jgi:Tfp pilus assembly protein PilW